MIFGTFDADLSPDACRHQGPILDNFGSDFDTFDEDLSHDACRHQGTILDNFGSDF